MERQTERIHFTMALIGGYLGVYALLHFGNLFGSAQTSNLISVVTCLLGGNWVEFGLRVGGMLLYMAAIALTVFLPHHLHADLRLMSLFIDALTALILGLLPSDIPPVLGLYPLFFSMAFQWNAFPGTGEFASATIFSTNNLRQFTSALTEVCLNHDPLHGPALLPPAHRSIGPGSSLRIPAKRGPSALADRPLLTASPPGTAPAGRRWWPGYPPTGSEAPPPEPGRCRSAGRQWPPPEH